MTKQKTYLKEGSCTADKNYLKNFCAFKCKSCKFYEHPLIKEHKDVFNALRAVVWLLMAIVMIFGTIAIFLKLVEFFT